MTIDELTLLKEQLATCSYYLEFGSGSSTISAAKLANIKKASIVESDKTFINDKILIDPYIREAIDKKRFEVLYVNIGDTKAWGGQESG